MVQTCQLQQQRERLLLLLSILLSLLTILQSCCDIKWVHFPKTGSTFCLTLQHICQSYKFETFLSSYENISSIPISLTKGCVYFNPASTRIATCYFHQHRPIPPSTKSYTNYVGLFREPNSRVVSAFLDHQHHEGMSVEIIDRHKKKYSNLTKVNVSEAFEAYLALPGMKGCQVKMLIGYPCVADVNITQEMMDKAFMIVNSMKFVGLTERYNESIIAFHHVAGNSSTPHAIELQSYRIRIMKRFDDIVSKAINVIGYHDEYDTALYQEVSRVFERTLANITNMSGISHRFQSERFGLTIS